MDEQRETPDPADQPAKDTTLEAVVDRVAERFPTVDRSHIEDVVQTEAANLEDGARVTDFIPVLVEHEVKEQLRTEADPAPLDLVADDGDGSEDPRRAQKRVNDPTDTEVRTSTTPLLPHDLDGRN